MNEQEFNALFGAFGPEGRRPTVCAATGRRLNKSDHLTRQSLPGTGLWVFHIQPLSQARYDELMALAKAGLKSSSVASKAKEE